MSSVFTRYMTKQKIRGDFLPTFCMVTKSRSSKTKLGITRLPTLKPVWLFRPLLHETYKRDRLHKLGVMEHVVNAM
jgi:hypothetical protein